MEEACTYGYLDTIKLLLQSENCRIEAKALPAALKSLEWAEKDFIKNEEVLTRLKATVDFLQSLECKIDDRDLKTKLERISSRWFDFRVCFGTTTFGSKWIEWSMTDEKCKDVMDVMFIPARMCMKI